MTKQENKKPVSKLAAKIIISLVIIAVGGAAWAYFQATAPRIKKKPREQQITRVDVMTVQSSSAQTVIKAMGTVVPSREVALKARVSGEVVEVSPDFTPGGRVRKGDLLLKLDPADYEVNYQKAESALKKAEAALEIENGNQTIAREELRLLSQTLKSDVKRTDLALRKPQLKQAQAGVAEAEANLRQARLNLERTQVYAPFNALIIDRNVNTGSHVNSQETLATIVSTDEYWVEAVVPLDHLSSLEMHRKNGSPAIVRSQSGYGEWKGRAVRAAGKLSDTSRMAKVIIAIQDPLGLEGETSRPQLMLDDYVSIEIQGRKLASVIDLPRSALRDGNRIWVYNDGALEIRSLEPAWKQGDRVFINSGIEPGDKIIVSNLSVPVQGMPLKVANETENNQQINIADTEKDEQ